jgi:hypothetical protein
VSDRQRRVARGLRNEPLRFEAQNVGDEVISFRCRDMQVGHVLVVRLKVHPKRKRRDGWFLGYLHKIGGFDVGLNSAGRPIHLMALAAPVAARADDRQQHRRVLLRTLLRPKQAAV